MCNFYQKYELGELDESLFLTHMQNCRVCQKLTAGDQKLLALAGTLNQPVRAPLLWARIENQIRAEQRHPMKWRRQREEQWSSVWRLAAAVVITLGIALGSYLFWKPVAVESPALLAANALKRVEKIEQEYVAAIADLETSAHTQMNQMDLELMLLYRDRLATIDTQVQRCREALALNPANAHIRRYLLAALQDKKQTLAEIVEAEARLF